MIYKIWDKKITFTLKINSEKSLIKIDRNDITFIPQVKTILQLKLIKNINKSTSHN